MDKKKRALIVHDREVLGLSYRSLGEKYGLAHTGIYAMLKSNKKQTDQEKASALEAGLPDDVRVLKEELRKARLKLELQDLMIDIASKELGVDIRKKSGTRRSK